MGEDPGEDVLPDAEDRRPAAEGPWGEDPGEDGLPDAEDCRPAVEAPWGRTWVRTVSLTQRTVDLLWRLHQEDMVEIML